MSRSRGRAAVTRHVVGAAVLAALATLWAGPSTAAAARGLKTGFGDPLFTSSSASVRATWLDRAVADRAGIVRLNVHWRGIVGSSRPANPANPADPSYDFGDLDAAVANAGTRGLDILLTVFDAPGWAEGPNRPGTRKAPPGTWKPKAGDFGDFAQALATRYSGSFSGLPRVRYFQAWNEPNLSIYLTPQWKHRRAKSPGHYRRMLNAFYAGVKQAQPGGFVVSGGTAPFGDPPGQSRMRPLTFLRKLLCVNARLRGTKCKNRAHLNALAHHPINVLGGPHRSAVNPNDATTPDFKHVRRILRAAERHHRVLPGGHHALWATEFWWESNPPDRFFGVRLGKHARRVEETLYLLWKQGASVAVSLQIRDSKYRRKHPGDTLQAGVFFHNGRKKPAFRAFRFPFVTQRRSRHKLRAWGKAPATGSLRIERRKRGHWRQVKSLSVHRGAVFRTRLRLRGKQTLRARVGGERSLPWHQKG